MFLYPSGRRGVSGKEWTLVRKCGPGTWQHPHHLVHAKNADAQASDSASSTERDDGHLTKVVMVEKLRSDQVQGLFEGQS